MIDEGPHDRIRAGYVYARSGMYPEAGLKRNLCVEEAAILLIQYVLGFISGTATVYRVVEV